MKKATLWTKEFITISIINFLATLTYFLLIVTIASYAVEEFGVSTSMAGLVSSIFIIGSLFGRLGGGKWITSQGASKILWYGLILFAISCAFYFVATTIPLLLANRFLQGIAVGLIGTAAGTIIARILPDSRKGEGIGYYSLSAILATAIGPFFGILLLKLENGFFYMFIGNFVLAIACITIYFFIRIELPPLPARPKEKGSLIAQFIEPKAVPISIIALLIGFAYSGVMSFLSFYAQEINLVTASGYFFLAYALIVLATRPYTGKLFDTRGANIIVYPCLAVFALGMALFSQATTSWMLLLAAMMMGFGYGNFNSIAQTIAVKSTEPHRFGLATSTYFILFDLGLGAGPYLLGFFENRYGYRAIFLAMVVVILICIPLYHVLHGRKEHTLRNAAK